MGDLLEISGLQGALEEAKATRESEVYGERSKQVVADSVALLQASGQNIRSGMGISDVQVDIQSLCLAIRNIASEADPKIVKLAKQLIAFIGSGYASSESIFNHFAPANRHDAQVLKQTLKAVAVLDKTRHEWSLRSEMASL
jgi:hypothetical protein